MKVVGTSRPIHDAVGKVTGRTKYAGDIELANMAHLALVYSTIPHGYVKKIDDSAALAMEGVLGVYHCFNTTEKLYNRYRTQYAQDVSDQERVFNDHVRFVGDRVAAVAAVTKEIAKKAAALVKVEYEELPFSVTIEDSLAGKIDNIHPEGAVSDDFVVEIGEKPQPVPGQIEVVTEEKLSRLNHITMEPHACVADYDPSQGELTIYSPNQDVHGIRTVIAELFEIPYHKVRVVKATMGGSFGAKQEWMLEPVASCVAMKLGRPVKLVFTRAEAMISTICRAPMQAKMKGTYSPEGKLLSVEMDVTNDAGAYVGNSMDYIRAMSSKLFRCYTYPHAHYTARAVCTNTPVSGAYRGWSAPEIVTVLEHNFNQAAIQLKMDPLELRLRNVALPGDFDPKNKIPMGEVRTKECLELGREKFEWEKKLAEDEAFNRENPRYRRGTAVACGGHLSSYFPRFQDFGMAEMRMTEDGTVIANITLHDHGCGTVIAFKMIIAEELGIDVDQIKLGEGDTDHTPFDYGCFSSRTTFVIGRATQECAKRLKENLMEVVARVKGLQAKDMYVEDAVIRCVSAPEVKVTYAEAARMSYMVLRKEAVASYQHANMTNPGVTGTHFAHVEVDTYTGMSRILDYLAVHDIGQAINRGMCIAQIQGSVLMGSGAALSEHLRINEQGGSIPSLKDYHLINAPVAPSVQVELIEDGQTEGPFGAKSIGEVCHVPVAAAVAGAVNKALGASIGQIPMNPDLIMATISKEVK